MTIALLGRVRFDRTIAGILLFGVYLIHRVGRLAANAASSTSVYGFGHVARPISTTTQNDDFVLSVHMVGLVGLEPTTLGLKARYSAN